MYEGRTAYLTATASGINVKNYEYQWKKRGGMHFPNKVIGVNGTVLKIPSLTRSDEGHYYCIVTNEWGRSLKSALLTLTVESTYTCITCHIYYNHVQLIYIPANPLSNTFPAGFNSIYPITW